MTKGESVKAMYLKRKANLIGLLGGACQECGSVDRLEFHHIDPSNKVDNVTTLLTSKESVSYEEAKKCQLLCCACHLKTRQPVHGTIGMYRSRKCRCDDCKTVWNEATKRWKKGIKLRDRLMGRSLCFEQR